MMIQITHSKDLILIDLEGSFNAQGSRMLEIELIKQKILSNDSDRLVLESVKSKTIQINLNELRYISAAGLHLLSIFINPKENVCYELMVGENQHICSLLKYAFTGMALNGIESSQSGATPLGKS